MDSLVNNVLGRKVFIANNEMFLERVFNYSDKGSEEFIEQIINGIRYIIHSKGSKKYKTKGTTFEAIFYIELNSISIIIYNRLIAIKRPYTFQGLVEATKEESLDKFGEFLKYYNNNDGV